VAEAKARTDKPKADESEEDAPQERKPVWNVATMGPVPDDREGVYDIELPAAPISDVNPSGVPVDEVNKDDAKQ
jgi:hypothetical protein